MKSIDQLITFKTVADCNSFTKAANQLSLSAAAVGKQVKMLEKEVGSELFYRTTRHVNLTELGLVFYQQCERILNELKKADQLVADYHGEVSGTLRVLSTLYMGEYELAPKLAAFMERYPKITIQLELADRIPDLEREDIDIIVGMTNVVPEHYLCRKLKQDRYILFASPKYLKRFGTPQTPKDLLNHRYLALAGRPQPALIDFGKGQKIHVNPVFWSNSILAVVRCAIDGMGIALTHQAVVAGALADGSLQEILADQFATTDDIYAFFLASRSMQPKLRAFIDYLSSVDW